MSDFNTISASEKRETYTKKFKQRYTNKKSSFNILKKVFFYAHEYRFYLYLALFLDIICTVCTVFIPIYTGYCIDCIIGTGNVNFNLLYKNMFYVGLFAIGFLQLQIFHKKSAFLIITIKVHIKSVICYLINFKTYQLAI